MDHSHEAHRGSAAFLLIIPGAVITGLGIGLAFRQPGFGLVTGFGTGLLIWGLIVALVGPSRS